VQNKTTEEGRAFKSIHQLMYFIVFLPSFETQDGPLRFQIYFVEVS